MCIRLTIVGIRICLQTVHQPTAGEGLPKLVPFISVLCHSNPCHANKLYYFISPSSFLSSLTSRTYYWSPLCCYLYPPVVLSSGKVSCQSPFLDFNLFYDILDISLPSDPFASFSVFLGNSWRTSFHVSLCCSKFLFHFFVIAQVPASYVIDGNIHWSKTLGFRHNGMLLFIMSFNFIKCFHSTNSYLQ